MQAIRQYEYGPAENLRYERVSDPSPGRGQVRVAVRAAGVHLIDTALRRGETTGPFPPPELPVTPGREVAGIVDEVGELVDASWLGRPVVAHLGPGSSGGYAELAVVSADALHPLPDGLDFAAAVAMIGTGRTTVGVLQSGPFDARDVLLVLAAAGGIGSLLVQLGKQRGATVIGAAGGPAKVARVRELGADLAVDYTQPDWPAHVRAGLGPDRTVSVVFEGVGGKLGRAALELLAPGGRIVMYGWAAGAGEPTTVDTGDLMARGLTASWALGPAMTRRRTMRELETEALALAAGGQAVPLVETFPLAEAAAAHRALETRGTVGKVVLTP